MIHTPFGRESALKENRNERFNYNDGEIIWERQFLKKVP